MENGRFRANIDDAFLCKHVVVHHLVVVGGPFIFFPLRYGRTGRYFLPRVPFVSSIYLWTALIVYYVRVYKRFLGPFAWSARCSSFRNGGDRLLTYSVIPACCPYINNVHRTLFDTAVDCWHTPAKQRPVNFYGRNYYKRSDVVGCRAQNASRKCF